MTGRMGDRERLEQCYDRTNRNLWKHIYSILKNESDTYDVLQSAYLRLIDVLLKRKDLSDAAIDAYLVTIARNLAFKWYHARRKTVPTDRMDDVAVRTGGERNLEEREDHHMRSCALRQAMKRLPPRYHHLIYMKFYQGLSNEEIGKSWESSLKASGCCRPAQYGRFKNYSWINIFPHNSITIVPASLWKFK